MANFQNNAITERGILLRSHVDMGAVFTATKIVMGSGYIPAGKTAKTITDVVAPVKELAINKKERSNDGKVIFGGAYTNEGIDTEFYFRELALYAKAVYPDGTEVDEVLYCYGNAEDSAELMAAYSTSTAVERQMDIVTFVGNEAKIDLTIQSGLYLSHAEKHAEGGDDPITPFMIGAVRAKLLGSYGAETTIADQVQYWFDQGIRWGIFHAALCADLPEETIQWDNGIEFKVLSGFRVEVTATALNAMSFTRHYDTYTKSWVNDWDDGSFRSYKEIPGGADLNDYRYPGKYYKTAGATDLLNYPSMYGAFSMVVERTGSYGVGVTQTIKDHKGNIFVRSFAAETDSDWTKWDSVLTSAGDSTIEGIMRVNNGTGLLLSWMENEYTGIAIDAKRGDKEGRLEVFARDDNAEAYVSYFNGASWTSHTILHTGNMAQYIGVAQAGLEE